MHNCIPKTPKKGGKPPFFYASGLVDLSQIANPVILPRMKKILFLFLVLFVNNIFCQTKDSNDDGRTIKIPVIFHIIYSKTIYTHDDKSLNTTDNISDVFILKELEDLKLDFLAKNDMSNLDPAFKELIGYPNIEFYIADTVLQPKGSKGIIRVSDNDNNNSLNLKSKPVDPKKYLNVYIGNVGNATNINSDWVNLSYREIGLHTHVLTHETGHWLGLYHIWGKTGSCNWFKTLFHRSDGIDDTPPQRKCSDLKFASCPPKNRATEKNQKANYNNFMDYCKCRCMFTVKQSIKMRNNIINLRMKIYSNSKP